MSLMPRMPQFKLPLPDFLLSNGKADIVPNMRFLVIFNLHIMGFQSVSDIGDSKDVQYISEGGRNDSPIMVKAQQRTAHKLTFKRGIVLRSVVDTAINFLGLPGVLSPQLSLESPGSVGTIIVLNQTKQICAMYGFISQGVLDWSVAELNAERAEPLIETFTVVHQGLVNMPVTPLPERMFF